MWVVCKGKGKGKAFPAPTMKE